MSLIETNLTSRRTFIKNTGHITAVSALAGAALPAVHAKETSTIQVALVGCGGRGSGAAQNALSSTVVPTKLVAMADVFENRLSNSYKNLSKNKKTAAQVDVPKERQFVGFDGYKQAMDCLKPGDVVILATPPGFRWVHFSYAIQKGLNVFMEKPVTVDGPTSKKMFKLAEEADKKNLKVGVGLMVRHCRARQRLHDRIHNGREIGDIILMRAYRMHPPAGSAFALPKPADMSETLYQVSKFHSFLWASGGLFSDFNIHQIDECSWMKNAWPVKAHGVGGRHYRGECVDQNFDSYAVEYTYPDGTKLMFNSRIMNGCQNEFGSYAHGTRGSAIITTAAHTPGKVRTFRKQLLADGGKPIWAFPQPEQNPYQLEWDDLFTAIIKNTPYNEVKRGTIASLVTSMGRMAAHTGQTVTYDQILNSDHEFAPDVDKLTPTGPAPLVAGPNGKYPVPMPGITTKREYNV